MPSICASLNAIYIGVWFQATKIEHDWEKSDKKIIQYHKKWTAAHLKQRWRIFILDFELADGSRIYLFVTENVSFNYSNVKTEIELYKCCNARGWSKVLFHKEFILKSHQILLEHLDEVTTSPPCSIHLDAIRANSL